MRVFLKGNSKDRRKQLRKIRKENPNCEIKLHSNFMTLKRINGKVCMVEEANRPLTEVIIKE